MQQSISWAIKWARLWSKVRLAELAAHTLQHSVILTSQFGCRAAAADAALCMIALSRMQTADPCLARQAWLFVRSAAAPQWTQKRGAQRTIASQRMGRAGGRVREWQASSRWMPCDRHFPSKRGPNSGIARQ